MHNPFMPYQTVHVRYPMITNITTVFFIVVMGIAVMYFHNFGRCCLILEIVVVTGEYVYLINGIDGLIILLVIIVTKVMSIIVSSSTWGPLATWLL